MSDLRRYTANRKVSDPQFAEGFDAGYERFRIGVILRQAREEAGLTQEQLATKLHTKKSAISRLENHAEDIRLSTLYRFAAALGRRLEIGMS